MVNLDLIFALVFYGVLFVLFLRYRGKFVVQGKIFVLYKTKFGLKLMDKISKIWPKLLKVIGVIGVVVGFLGMINIFYILAKGAFDLVFNGGAPVVAPVFPGMSIGGVNLGFWHWIVGLFIIAVIHEFSHGIVARLYGVKIKSSGFAFLGPLLAAFVEPDEKQMKKVSKLGQLSVFAAGPFSNIVSGILVFIVLMLFVNPFALGFYNMEGVEVVRVEDGLPFDIAGIEDGEVVEMINGVEVVDVIKFRDVMMEVEGGSNVLIKTDKGEYNVLTVEKEEKAHLGVFIQNKLGELKEKNWKISLFLWFRDLLNWVFVFSLGVGLFNLLPLAIVDGGRMINTFLSYFLKKEKVHKIWLWLTWFVLVLLFINLLPFFLKLVGFLKIF